MNGNNKESIETIVTTSATLAGISIAIGTITIVIFYQHRAFGDLDVAKLWLDIFQLCMYSFFLFGISYLIGFAYLNFKRLQAKITRIAAQVIFIIAWLVLFLIVYRLMAAAEFASKIIGG